MKTTKYNLNTMNFLTKVFSAILFLLTISVYSSNNSNLSTSNFYGNSHFEFAENLNGVSVEINKKPFEAFTININDFDVYNNPVCRIAIQSESSITLRIDISDGNSLFENIHNSSSDRNLENRNYEFDFSAAVENFMDNTEVFLIFYINPGSVFNGEILINELSFNAPEINIIENDFQISQDEIDNRNNDSVNYEVSVYPNPTTDYININLPSDFEGAVVITDVNGKKVIERNIDLKNPSGEIDLSTIDKGLYIVNIINSELSISSKVQVM